MLLSPDLMRVLLAICLLGMALLASFFLRQRKLTVVETLAWGMLILLIPLMGPFLVILLRPGQKSLPAS